MKFIGKLITGDFEEKTMTFEIEGEMILQAGEYSITKIDCESEVKKLDLLRVSESFADIGRILLNKNVEIKRDLDGFKRFVVNGKMVNNTKRLYEKLSE